MVVAAAPDVLEDDDVLEMVNAGLMPITVVDDYLADFWRKVFTDLKVHSDVTLRTGGVLAVAMRKDNPKLRDEVNRWIAEAWQRRWLPQRARAPLPGQRQVREERDRGVGAEEAARSSRAFSRSTASSTTSTTC